MATENKQKKENKIKDGKEWGKCIKNVSLVML